MKMTAKILVSAFLALAMLIPGLFISANASVNQTLMGPNCGATGVLSGSGPLTCTYTTVGSDIFSVPTGVTQATVTVVGAQGGHYFIAGDAAHGGSPAGDITGRPGGNGGEATGTLTNLTPGQVLQVDVAGIGIDGTAASRSGGQQNGPSGGLGALGGFGGSNSGVAGGPGDASGANGGTAFGGGNGSGGGGSSDVRLAPGGCAALRCALADRVLVGAGGGGGGGIGGSGNALGGAGGDGGGATGVDGGAIVDGGNAGVSGTGGTQTAGGTGGLNPGRHASGAIPTDPRYGGDGANGSSGAGGVGGGGNLPCAGTQNPPCSGGQNATTSGGGAGGGAGGGSFGGGGGSGGGGLSGGGGGAGGGAAGGSSFAAATVSSPTLTPGVNTPTSPINSGNGQVTITWTAPAGAGESLTTTASGSVAVGGQISDTATLSGGSAPTGTITFKVYGPGDTTCATALTSSSATVSGNGTYKSAPVTATTAGTYQWIASYGGDTTNTTISGSCGDRFESVTVAAAVLATPSLSTVASAPAVVGDRLTDTATLSGGNAPTGTLTFNVYGPGDTSCATSLRTLAATVSGDGTYTPSGGFRANNGAGTYRWIASYSGDSRNAAVSGSCGDSGESVTVIDRPSLSTVASPPSVVVHGQISDTAMVSGGSAPTGTITFTLYGPGDTTCATPLTTSTATVAGAGTYHSAAVTANTLGTYHWIASYGGDTNNAAVSGSCGDSGESVRVTLPSSGASAYVTDFNNRTVLQYTIAVDGTLSSKTPATVATGPNPGPIAVSADGKRAYIVNEFGPSVSQYTIAADGTLSPMTPATVATGSGPVAIAVSADGKSAYVGNFNDKTLSQYTIAADGTLSPKTPATVAVGSSPNAIAVSADGHNAYTANVDKTVSQFTVAVDGTLSPKTPATVAVGSSPNAIAVSADGHNAYTANVDKTVSQFTVAVDGTLSPKTPATVATGLFSTGIAVSADSKSVYVTNKGDSTLRDSAVSQYTVAADGTLSPKTPATVPTGRNPDGLALSADGNSAYVINAGDSTLSQYTVAADGTLSPKTPATVATGQFPFAIAVAPAPRATTTATQLRVTPSSPAAVGTAETLTATVTPSAAGSVQFKDETAPLGNPVTVTNGTASMTTTLPVGIHSLSAVFTPTDPVAFTGSTSTAVSYVVYATATHTTLTVDPNPAFQGIPVVLTAHVSPHGAARGAAGTIQFTDGTTPLGNPQPVNPGGIALLITSTLTTGDHTLTAVFTPTNPVAFGPSTSPPVPLTVRSFLR